MHVQQSSFAIEFVSYPCISATSSAWIDSCGSAEKQHAPVLTGKHSSWAEGFVAVLLCAMVGAYQKCLQTCGSCCSWPLHGVPQNKSAFLA